MVAAPMAPEGLFARHRRPGEAMAVAPRVFIEGPSSEWRTAAMREGAMYTREHAFRIAEALIRSGEYPHPRQPETPPPPSFTIALSREAGSGGILIAARSGGD